LSRDRTIFIGFLEYFKPTEDKAPTGGAGIRQMGESMQDKFENSS
jgi:hypothetical protein